MGTNPLTENKAFTDKAIRKMQTLSPDDPLLPSLMEYLIKFDRVFLGPGDMLWVVPTNSPAEVITACVGRY